MKNLKALFSSREKAFVMIADVVLFLISFLIASFIRWGETRLSWWMDPALIFILWITLVGMYIVGSYDLDDEVGFRSFVLKIALAVGGAAVVAMALNYLLGMDRAEVFGRGILLGALLIFAALAALLRLLLFPGIQSRRARLSWLLLTSQEDRENIESELRLNKLQGRLEFLNLSDDVPLNVIEAALSSDRRSGIILAADPRLWEKRLGNLLVEARMRGQGIVSVSGVYEWVWKRVPVQHLDPNWFFHSEGFGLISSGRKQKLKRLCDLLLAFTFLFFLWPVMLLTALAVRLESRGGALYRQVRTGKGGEEFTILKFRSMRVNAEANGAQWAKAKDDRMTRIGGFIRKTRLDELPQLFNVLTGEMSFIGPRPERPEFNEELARQIPYYNLRHMVRPGLTGWAQISYPYGASVEDAHRKLEYDLYYIKHQSLLFDFKIILRTARVVLLAAGR